MLLILCEHVDKLWSTILARLYTSSFNFVYGETNYIVLTTSLILIICYAKLQKSYNKLVRWYSSTSLHHNTDDL